MAYFNLIHHLRIARLIKTIPNEDVRAVVAMKFLDMLQEDNERFDEKRFMVNCEVIND